MVELQSRRYGVDQFAGLLCFARATSSTDSRSRPSRPGRGPGRGVIIDEIVAFSDEKENGFSFDSKSRLCFSVFEKDAVIKRLKSTTGDGLDPDRVARFELASTLPGGEEMYYLDSTGDDSDPNRIAVAYDRRQINRRISFFEKKYVHPSGFKLRSLALAAGYNFFCKHNGGRLICLIDISGEQISYCFLSNGLPLRVGALECTMEDNDFDSIISNKQIIDLTATLRFQHVLLSDEIGSLPLSLIIVSGTGVQSDTTAIIEEALQIKTVPPQLRKELFTRQIFESAEKYLVAIGLTVD